MQNTGIERIYWQVGREEEKKEEGGGEGREGENNDQLKSDISDIGD